MLIAACLVLILVFGSLTVFPILDRFITHKGILDFFNLLFIFIVVLAISALCHYPIVNELVGGS